MLLWYTKFLVLANLLMLLVLQSQFGQIYCESTEKEINKLNFNEEKFSHLNDVAFSGANVKEGKVEVVDMKSLLNQIPDNKEVKHHNEMTDSEIEFMHSDCSIPTESSSDGRLSGVSRGRSRKRHFKCRFGEKNLESSIDSNGDPTDQESVKYETEDEKGKLSDYGESGASELEKESSEGSVESFQSKDSAPGDNETEPEEMGSPMPIIPAKEETKSRNSVDQVIQLLHDQSNLEALKNAKRKKELKKEKLENQEMIMDKLMSVIDSMQKRVNLRSDYVYGALKNHNISDLKTSDYLQKYNHEDVPRNEQEDLIKRSRIFEQSKIQHELKTASMAKKYYSKPKSNLASELLMYSPSLDSNKKKSDSRLNYNENQLLEQNKPAFQHLDESKILPKNTNAESPIQSPIKSDSVTKTLRFSDSATDDYTSTQGYNSKLGESSGDNSDSSKPYTKDVQSPEETNSSIIAPIQSPDDKNHSTSPLYNLDQIQEEQELSEQNEKLEKRNSESPILMLESELMKLQNLVSPDLKKTTPLNNVGRIKPKSFYSNDEYLTKTSAPENNFLNKGRVSVGRIRRTRESKQAITQSPQNKSVSKPFVTVGRLKSPTRTTLIDKMRPIAEEDSSVYDYNTAAAVFNIKSSKLDIEEQNSKFQKGQLKNSFIVPGFVPSDLSETDSKETYFLGDRTPSRSNQSAFRKGMIASMSQNMAGNRLPEGIGFPIVRVQKVKGETEKRVIRKKV